MNHCQYHTDLDKKIDQIAIGQARITALLEEAVVKKTEMHTELAKVYIRINTDKDKNRNTLGVLVGVITLMGGTIGYLIKTMV